MQLNSKRQENSIAFAKIIMTDDHQFMQEALKEAKKAFSLGEVPIGAVVVYRQKIIARGYNCVEFLQDATAHAEMLVLRIGAKILNNWRLSEAVLYCTLEPCAMCAGAMILSRIKKLVYGAPDLRHGVHRSIADFLQKKHPIHTIEISSGICADEAAKLMKKFFQETRKKGSKKWKKSLMNLSVHKERNCFK